MLLLSYFIERGSFIRGPKPNGRSNLSSRRARPHSRLWRATAKWERGSFLTLRTGPPSNYNITPTQNVLAIRRHSETGERTIDVPQVGFDAESDNRRKDRVQNDQGRCRADFHGLSSFSGIIRPVKDCFSLKLNVVYSLR
jgi:hypothetical protein